MAKIDDLARIVERLDERTKNQWVFGGIVAAALFTWLSVISAKLFLGPLTLTAIAASPVTEKTIQQAKALVAESRKDIDKPRITPAIIRAVGQNMISASSAKDHTLAQDSWALATDLMSYRSVLNESLSPIPNTVGGGRSGDFIFEVTFDKAPPPDNVGADVLRYLHTYGEDVPLEQAARYENLGSTANAARSIGPRGIIAEFQNNPIKIDGQWLKNVVFRKTLIVYHGGPIRLENVYFVDCTFQMDNLAPARSLGERLLSEAAISFDITAVGLIRQPYASSSRTLHAWSAMPAAIAGVMRSDLWMRQKL
jgi:hypothetical protein